MQWPDELELTLDGIAQGGEGVGRWEGRVLFAGGGLPGERVRLRLRECHDTYARGDVVEVLDPSPDRTPPRLPNAGWMSWQHIAYPAQLRFKRQILADQLAKFGGLADVQIAETIPAPHLWGYRNSARLHSDGNRIGYYVAESHVLDEIASDPLLLPALNEALAALRRALPIRALPDEAGGASSEIILRVSETHGYVVAAVRGPLATQGLAAHWRKRFPALAGVALLPPSDTSQPFACVGADHLIEELGEVAFSLRPTTFFQVNLAAAEQLLQLVRAGLSDHPINRLLDLYCGSGTFTLPLARQFDEVVGVEEFVASVEDARTTAKTNQIANARFIVGRVERAIEQIDTPFEAAILDPPRRGCHPMALAALLRLAPSRLVYVSCHPATLARDLKIITAGGYHLMSVQPVDLFPQTPHVECVCVLGC